MFAVFILLQIVSFSRLYGHPDDRFTYVNSYLNSIEEHNKSMLTLSMSNGNKNSYHRSIGFMDFNSNQKSGMQTQYPIGGLSKLFTSIVIMQMVDEKIIQLGTPLSRFFPELPYAKNISIEDLLAENILIADYLPGGRYYQNYLNGRNFKSTLNADYLPNKYSLDPIRAAVHPNYLLLGLIIEKITNCSYHQVVTERVINRAGLSNTFDGSNNKITDQSTIAYTISNHGIEPEGRWDISSLKGAASIYSTPSDMVQLLTVLFNGDMVSTNSLKNMKRPRYFSSLGFQEQVINGKQAYGFKSQMDGFVNEWLYVPVDTLSIAYSMNLDDSKSETIMQDLLSAYYKNIGS